MDDIAYRQMLSPPQKLLDQPARPTILVVDDDESVRTIVQTYAHNAGYDVLLTASGKEAISAAAAKRPDVLITEMVLPKMDGFEVIQHFRAAFPALKIVVMSEIHRVTYLNAALRLGADCALTKPLTEDKLLEAIRREVEPEQ